MILFYPYKQQSLKILLWGYIWINDVLSLLVEKEVINGAKCQNLMLRIGSSITPIQEMPIRTSTTYITFLLFLAFSTPSPSHVILKTQLRVILNIAYLKS